MFQVKILHYKLSDLMSDLFIWFRSVNWKGIWFWAGPAVSFLLLSPEFCMFWPKSHTSQFFWFNVLSRVLYVIFWTLRLSPWNDVIDVSFHISSFLWSYLTLARNIQKATKLSLSVPLIKSKKIIYCYFYINMFSTSFWVVSKLLNFWK